VTIWNSLVEGLGSILTFFHDVTEPFTGANAWGWGIVLLTVAVRVVLLPLAVKQTNSMRAMQQLQPEIKKLQTKYKTDRQMMKTNPEKYRERRQKQQEATMALYKEHGVNPAAGCLPLLLQMPIFFALFRVLVNPEYIPELSQGAFYIVRDLTSVPTTVGLGAYVLVLAMGATTFVSQRQMMASNPSAAAQPQQKVLLYVMPLMLVVFGFNMPVGVLLYWVTTNLWTLGQQYVMFRNIQPAAGAKTAQA
jgi:YidC/Oxa1 family membrane protein insertase